jgi:hypothetical protein
VLFCLTDEIEVISFANAAVIASVEDANLSDAEFNCVTTFFCEVYVVCNLLFQLHVNESEFVSLLLVNSFCAAFNLSIAARVSILVISADVLISSSNMFILLPFLLVYFFMLF